MSYEAIVRWCGRAETAIDDNKIEEAHRALINAQDIIRDLAWNLDFTKGGEVAGNLRQIYDYLTSELVWANLEKSKDRIANVRQLIQPLLEAWRVAVVKARRERVASAGQSGDAARAG